MKKRLFNIIVQSFLITFILAQPNWQWQNPLPQGNFLTDLCFVDSLYGWSVGYNGTVMRTINGGNDWEVITTNFDYLIGKVCFIDRARGWLMTGYENIIYHTSDGGISWDSLACLDPLISGGSDLFFINDSVGFACGGKILRTTDGGLNWQETPIPVLQGFQTIYFINENVGWSAGTGPYVLKTTDRGATWNETYLPVSPYGFAAYKIYFIDNLNGFIGGYDTNHGVLLNSIDGGNSWGGRLFTNTLDNVYFSSSDTGWVKDIPGNIYYTSDRGNNWVSMTNSCYDFYFLKKNQAWGIFNLNLIKKTVDGWNTSDFQTPSVTSKILWSLDVLDSQNVVACGQKKNIIGTANGGRNWSIYFCSDSNYSLKDIRYIREDEIWSVGNGGSVVSTKDGGISWQEMNLSNGFLQSIDFVNDSLGYIVGNNGYGSDVFILRTFDGGSNWQLDTTFSNITYGDKVRFSHPLLGWLVTDKGILRSTNTGTTWEFVYNSETLFRDIAIIGNCAWITHYNWVLFTTDAGNSWQNVKVYDLQPPVARYLESISFTDSLNGWVTVQGGKIFKTIDGGSTWNPEKQISGVTLYSIRFGDSENGWAVGNGGAILYYGDKINSINIERNDLYPQFYYLYQNYPNPFNPSTTIHYKIPVTTEIELSLFNLLGQKVKVLYSGIQMAGSHKQQLSGKDLASGIYIYQLKSREFSDSKKCILIK